MINLIKRFFNVKLEIKVVEGVVYFLNDGKLTAK